MIRRKWQIKIWGLNSELLRGIKLPVIEMGKAERETGLGAEITGSVLDVVSLRCLLLVFVDMAICTQMS